MNMPCAVTADLNRYQAKIDQEDAEEALWEQLKDDYMDHILFEGGCIKAPQVCGLPRIIDMQTVSMHAYEYGTSKTRAVNELLENHSHALIQAHMAELREEAELAGAGL